MTRMAQRATEAALSGRRERGRESVDPDDRCELGSRSPVDAIEYAQSVSLTAFGNSPSPRTDGTPHEAERTFAR